MKTPLEEAPQGGVYIPGYTHSKIKTRRYVSFFFFFAYQQKSHAVLFAFCYWQSVRVVGVAWCHDF